MYNNNMNSIKSVSRDRTVQMIKWTVQNKSYVFLPQQKKVSFIPLTKDGILEQRYWILQKGENISYSSPCYNGVG